MMRQPQDLKVMLKKVTKHNTAARKGKYCSNLAEAPKMKAALGELRAAREAWKAAQRGVGVFLSLDFEVSPQKFWLFLFLLFCSYRFYLG